MATFLKKRSTDTGTRPAAPKSKTREWVDAIVFAVVAATLIRWLFMEAFTIPTPSMENSLLVGDFLFVSKMHYGARTPKTPLQVPLTHQKIWGTDIPSYSDLIQLPQYRLPGFTDVERGDVVVFNFPTEHQYPTDLKTNYIKRCIGTPGDVVQVIDRQVYVNDAKCIPIRPECSTATSFRPIRPSTSVSLRNSACGSIMTLPTVLSCCARPKLPLRIRGTSPL